ncbi:DNA repair protein RadA [bacterium]|nr:DNA repair protein RadA [bacterium]
MQKHQIIYACSNCGAQTLKWQGRCPECGKWGTLIEQTVSSQKSSEKTIKAEPGKTISFDEIKNENAQRIKTEVKEFDRVMGGGIVQGSLTLIGGEPGAGKSTLALQIAEKISDALYVSGEESPSQIKIRADRLKIKGDNIKFSSDTEIEKICALIEKIKPALVIIDSIQTVHSIEIENETGSVAQIRASAVKLLETAKKIKAPIFIIGHITKDGQIAGPKTLEHLVDTVVYLEGEDKDGFKILRAKKNRFGATSEIGIFTMKNSGLEEIKNPSKIFLCEKNIQVPGASVSSILKGTRTFLIEIQALVNKTIFGYPQRRAFGFDTNRLQILSAVLTRRANINLIDQDINLNITGGIKITDPASDLAICMAIVSAYKNKILPNGLVIMGEVGLGGEIRNINKIDQKIKESIKLGFSNIMVPDSDSIKNISGVKLIKVKTLNEAIEKIL